MSPQRATPPLDVSMDSGVRKRVCKACDRCRLKKSKCDGSNPCGRCKTDNAICVFGERKKSHDKVYPKGYVELLEQQQSQLVNGLQELYRRLETSQGWPGASLQDSGNGHPLTHDILARLGVLSADGPEENESFEEDLDLVQQKLLDGGSGLTQRQDSGDSDSDHGHTPASFFDLSPTKLSLFRDPFTLAQLPPTPPTHSPYPRSGRSSHTQGSMDSLPQTQAPQANTYASMNPAILQRQMWPPAPVSYEENMDFAQQVGLPTMYQGIAGDFNRHLMAMNTMSPRVAIPDWNEEDFSAFLNPTTMV